MTAPDEANGMRHVGSAVRALAITAGVVALLWMLGPILEIVLLGFAGLLLALLLNGCGAWLAKRLHIPEKLGVAATCLVGIGLMVLTGFLAAPAIATQIDELSQELPKATDRVLASLERYGWGQAVVERLETLGDLLGSRETMSRAGGILSTTLGAVGGFVALLFIGLFVAFEPDLYRRGFLRLIPLRNRGQASQVLSEAAHTLRMWLAGKLLAMVVIGVLTWLGLLLLDVPLGLTLALLAALLTFIPNFGPILAAVPAVLLGLLDGPSQALYVVLLYVGVQTVESYILTPLVQKKTVSLPPALTLLGQVVMGVLAGGIGVVVATPLTAIALVLTKRLYVEGILGDTVDDPPPEASAR